MLVMDPKVQTTIDDMKFVIVRKCTVFSGPQSGNPAIYINKQKIQATVVDWVNSAAKVGKDITAEQSDTIVLNAFSEPDPPVIWNPAT